MEIYSILRVIRICFQSGQVTALQLWETSWFQNVYKQSGEGLEV